MPLIMGAQFYHSFTIPFGNERLDRELTAKSSGAMQTCFRILPKSLDDCSVVHLTFQL